MPRRAASALRPYTAAEVLALAPFAWWKAGDLALADGAAVASWSDASGNGRTLTQATELKKPAYSAGAINGLAAVRFSAADVDALATGAFTALAAPVTVFAVVKAPTSTPGATMYVMGGSSSGARRDIFYTTGRAFGAIGGASLSSTVTAPADTPAIVSAVFDGASSGIRHDAIGFTGDTGAQSPTLVVIGARNGQTASFNGWIGEVVYFAAHLTPAQIQRIERYLSKKWGIALSQPGVFYVDAGAGSDTNNTGRSASSPLATVAKASSLLGSAAGEIRLAAAATRESWVYTGAAARTVAPAVSGAEWEWYGSERHTSGWAAAGGGVYSKAVTGYAVTLVNVRVVSDLDASGFWTTLTPNTATPTTPAAGQFGFSGGVIYVHLTGDVDPNTKTIEAAKYDYAIFTSGAGVVAVVGGNVYMGNRAGIGCGSTGTDGKVIGVDVDAFYGGDLGCWATRADATYMRLTRCKGKRGMNDGFNVHGTAARAVEMTLTDCEGLHNFDEGASNHDDTVLNVIGGHYDDNVSGGGITAVDSAVAHISGGATCDRNRSAGPAVADQGGISFYDTTTSGSVDGASCRDNIGSGIFVKPGAAVTVDNLVSTGNTLPDTLP